MRRLVIAALLTLAAAALHAETLSQTIDKTFDVRPGATFALDNVNGHVNVTSWDQPRVRVHAVKTVSRADDPKGALNALQVQITPRDGGISVHTVYPSHGSVGFLDFLTGNWADAKVEYDITVPRSMSLDVETTNGAVEVTAVSGMLKVETTNGHIRLDRCAGNVDATTTNGRVTAELLSVDRTRSNRLSTTNGKIVLTVPSSLAAEIDASTTNGGIESEIAVTTHSMGRHSLRGTINGGGADLRLRTTNGSIEIRNGSATHTASR
ncbi:MAG TPA: DUF4097 family beta strand repeat-containing protein [Thermoanaerobaculia bacterium]|jgi:DUF4097 and DUF4098 domain-containing protein YvlB|nr:DUF4097 family beta strand repeat-containing protein [Thermoanaerobaculia bacterium]